MVSAAGQRRAEKRAGKKNTSKAHTGDADEGPSQLAHASAVPGSEPPSREPARSSGLQSLSSSATQAEASALTELVAAQTSRSNLSLGVEPQNSAKGSSEAATEIPSAHTAKVPAEASANDSAKDSCETQAPAGNTRVDWGADAYVSGDTPLMKRPGFGTAGEVTQLELNSHYVELLKPGGKGKGKEQYNSFYQYTICIGNGDAKRGLIKAVLGSRGLKNKLPGGEEEWLFDGKELAWSTQKVEAVFDHEIDLEQESGHASQDRRDLVRVVIKRSSKSVRVNFGSIGEYMNGKRELDANVVDAINLLDHVVRRRPAERFTTVKRSYFQHGNDDPKLGRGVEALHGIYQSIRLAEGPERPKGTQRNLLMAANVDRSYAPFWKPGTIIEVVGELTATDPWNIGSMDWRDRSTNRLNANFDLMRLLKDTMFTVKYDGMSPEAVRRKWKVDAILDRSAKDYSFQLWDNDGGFPGRWTNVYDYYRKKGVHLMHPNLPVIKTTKMITKRGEKDGEKDKILLQSPIVYPMELCTMLPNQRYMKNLDDEQTRKLVENAIQPPHERLSRIDEGLENLDWDNDPFLKRFGLKIHSKRIETKARILSPPILQFAGSEKFPETKPKPKVAKGSQIVKGAPIVKGIWNLTNLKFYRPNIEPLYSWGVMVVNSAVNGPSGVDRFIIALLDSYKSLGGVIENAEPLVHYHRSGEDLTTKIELFHDAVKKEYEKRPQILVFILPNTGAQTYLLIKKSCDCTFGVFSQCVQAEKAVKAEYGFLSNLLMKFNAKLGGTTNIIASQSRVIEGFGNVSIKPPGTPAGPPPQPASPPPAMYIGADVSHPAPGSQAPSYAAMTVSMDKDAARYAAAVQTNGTRDEIISTGNLNSCLRPLIERWKEIVGIGRLPDHVYYFRDGVGESRLKELLATEVEDMRKMFKELNGNRSKKEVKFTVVVCEKRHHIRFFPTGKPGSLADEHGNPLPGTIVDRDVTDCRGNDIYLCSHRALKGTARPTHYTMLLDEAKLHENAFQKMLNEQCYQYIRSTTAVSLHPAVYYAHLASKRAQAHDRTYVNGSLKGKADEDSTSSLGSLKLQGPRDTKTKSQPPSTSNSKVAPIHNPGDIKGKQKNASESSSKNTTSQESGNTKGVSKETPIASSKNAPSHGSRDPKGKQKEEIAPSSKNPTIGETEKAKPEAEETPSSPENPPDGPPEPLMEMKCWEDGQREWIGYGMWFI
ncbi:MAG: hypothetical protein Q9168_004410 [Polycauliona sp. 1 TL-2023]